jgi:threonine dehydrogenase-like Zn-dependent dehydrogenase
MLKAFEVLYNPRADQKFETLAINADSPISENDILVKPLLVGVCGSDLFHLESYRGAALRIGHEWIGDVIKVGAGVRSLKIGDRVTSSAVLACGRCEACTQGKSNYCTNSTILGSEVIGALRTHLVLKEHQLVKILGGDDQAQAILEVVAVGEQALIHLQSLKADRQRLLIFGAGSVGLCTAMVASSQGYEVILLETIPERIKRAQGLGYRVMALGLALLDPEMRHHFPLIIDASGDHLGGKGAWSYLTYFGAKDFHGVMVAKYLKPVQFDPNQLALLQARLVWMRGVSESCLRDTVSKWSSTQKLSELAQELVTHQIDFSSPVDLKQAFETAQDRSLSGKVLLRLPEGNS